MENTEFCTVKEFANILRIHPKSVRRGIASGHIQAFKVGSGKKSSYRIFRSEIGRMASFSSIDVIEEIIKKRIEK